MVLGFTGTRHGMTAKQREAFEALVLKLQPKELHHGDCVGADADAHYIFAHYMAEQDDPWSHGITIHLPDNDAMRAFCMDLDGRPGRVSQLPPLPYLERNHAIVDACDVLVACPSESTEQRRSGTWATVRYAGKVSKPVMLLFP